MCECDDVRVEMCKWSGHNVRVVRSGHNVRMNMECASASTVMCEWSGHNGPVRRCASRNVRVVWS